MAQDNTIKQAISEPKIASGPVLKWAGGKGRLLPELTKNFPKELLTGEIDTYIEPFVGGGAVFFEIYNNYSFKKAYLYDINPELIILYNSLKQDVDRVIDELRPMEAEYHSKATHEQRTEVYYAVRSQYNEEVAATHKAVHHTPFNARRAAMTIFLNRTCFNGLFRVNKSGGFNVPHGKNQSVPNILFEDKLRAASEALQNAEVLLGDFSQCEQHIDGKTFIYFDPPYRPLNVTSAFTSYSKEDFNDEDQARLAEAYRKYDKAGVLQLMSNSDPFSFNEDRFFEDLYKGFTINRIDAARSINSKGDGRSKIKEILVRNY